MSTPVVPLHLPTIRPALAAAALLLLAACTAGPGVEEPAQTRTPVAATPATEAAETVYRPFPEDTLYALLVAEWASDDSQALPAGLSPQQRAERIEIGDSWERRSP